MNISLVLQKINYISLLPLHLYMYIYSHIITFYGNFSSEGSGAL